ncbi:hypothetical protein GmHk_14G041152 [Glycine max]|nr:hypothetical protein GmHk_14G041152 [Glycine max]
MTTPPSSPPHLDIPLDATSRRTTQSTRLRRLTVRSLDQPRPTVNVNPATGRGSGPHKEKFHSYLGVVAREKIPIVHSNWIVVPETLKNLIWDEILGKFDIPEGDNAKKKPSLTTKYIYADSEGQAKDDPSIKYGIDAATWAKFAKSHQTPNWREIWKKAQEIQKFNDCPHLLSRGGYELVEKKLMDKKRKTREHQAEFTKNLTVSVDPLSPISRHLKWKMARTKRYGQMTSTAAQQIPNKIHPGRVCVAVTGVTISQYFGQASRGSTTSSTWITQQQLAEIIGNLKEEWRKEVKEENKNLQEAWRRKVEEENQRTLEIIKQDLKQATKLELSQIASQHSPPLQPLDIQVLTAWVSMKGSCAEPDTNPIGKDTSDLHVDTMGLFMNDWSTSLGYGSLYGFLEPQCIHNAKNKREDCQHYIQTWVKESQREVAHWQLVVLCPRDNIVVWFCSLRKKPDVNIKTAVNSAMKTLSTTLEGKADQVVPRWIEPKSHVQTGGCECGYHVMHWMWCIVSGGLMNEWNRWFCDGTSLNKEAMTTLRNK